MPLENEVEEELEIEPTSQDEPQSTVPEAGSFSREALTEQAYAEGTEEAVIDSLASKTGEITVDDLRQIPGAEKLTDAQLTAAWTKAQAEAGGKPGTSTDPNDAAATKVELPFPVYDAQGNKVEADKVTLGDLLSGKVQIGYQAMGKEQRKALSDVIRNASQGHWNEHRYNTVQGQYRESATRVQQLEREAQSHAEQTQQWNAALTALITGNNAPMRALVEAYKGALGKTGITPEGFIPRETVESQQAASEAGMQWYQDVGLPAAMDIANRYGANAQEVIGAIKYFIENEPALTQERIQEIIKFDVPMEFEKNGYVAKDAATTPGQNAGTGTDDVAGLKKQIEALSARIAGNANGRVEAIRAKGKKTPPAGSGATSGAGDSMPNFKNRDGMKKWLRGEEE